MTTVRDIERWIERQDEENPDEDLEIEIHDEVVPTDWSPDSGVHHSVREHTVMKCYYEDGEWVVERVEEPAGPDELGESSEDATGGR